MMNWLGSPDRSDRETTFLVIFGIILYVILLYAVPGPYQFKPALKKVVQ